VSGDELEMVLSVGLQAREVLCVLGHVVLTRAGLADPFGAAARMHVLAVSLGLLPPLALVAEDDDDEDQVDDDDRTHPDREPAGR